MKSLKGKIALVTGAANGIGKAIVELFYQEGANVIAVDIMEKELYSYCYSNNYNCMKLDVSKEEDWIKVINAIHQKYGQLDILVNNAGIVSGEKVADGTVEIWDQVMDVNAKGTYLGMKYVIPLMQKAGSGSIVNISSIAALIGTGGGTTYHASKGAIRAMSKRVATHYGQDNIRVNSIYPGWIETNMTKNPRKEKKEDFEKRQVLPYFGQPQDIAEGVLFLSSDKSRFITGAELVVDGGYTID